MVEKFSIFDNLVKDENSLTALFCNYLRFDLFRDEFLNVLNVPNEFKKKTNYYDFNIQYSLGEHGRPDLTIVNDDIAIYIEIKTNQFRGVTDNQPSGYIKSLLKTKAKHKKLVFLIPENYHYRDHINEKIKETIGYEKIEVVIINWESIIDIISKNELNKNNNLFQEYFDFLEYYFKPQKIKFMPAELSSVFNVDLANGFDKILWLTSNVSNQFKRTHPISYKTIKTDGFYEYGFLFTKDKIPILSFGFWFSSWKQNGSPICICLCDDETKGNKEVFQTIAKKNKLITTIVHDEIDEISFLCALIDKATIDDISNLNLVIGIVKDFANGWNFK